MGKDADQFLSKKGWIRDRSVDGGLIYCYNENKMKEALQKRFGINKFLNAI